AFTFFNLSDGEATLIQDRSHNILMNTGSDGTEYQLRELLEIYGVQKIDKLIITNASELYTGNVNDIINDYGVKSLISSKAIMDRLKKKFDIPNRIIKVWKKGKQKN